MLTRVRERFPPPTPGVRRQYCWPIRAWATAAAAEFDPPGPRTPGRRRGPSPSRARIRRRRRIRRARVRSELPVPARARPIVTTTRPRIMTETAAAAYLASDPRTTRNATTTTIVARAAVLLRYCSVGVLLHRIALMYAVFRPTTIDATTKTTTTTAKTHRRRNWPSYFSRCFYPRVFRVFPFWSRAPLHPSPTSAR